MHFSGRTMGVSEYITWWITSSLRQTRPRARHAENTKVDFRTISIQRMTCKDQPRSLYAHHSFFPGLFDNAIYRWLKELGNINSCAGNLHRWILYQSGNAEKHYWPWPCKSFDFGHLTGIEYSIITVKYGHILEHEVLKRFLPIGYIVPGSNASTLRAPTCAEDRDKLLL